jgi:hypothetical protein
LEENTAVGAELWSGDERQTEGSQAVFLAFVGCASVDWTLARPNDDDGYVLGMMVSKGAKSNLLQEL